MRPVFRRLLAALIVAWLALCGAVAASNPGRIISLAPSLTQSIYALGAEELLVGCTSYCTEAIKDGKTVVGSATKVNVEKAVSLRPDLVVISDLTSPEDAATLKKFGIQVVRLRAPRSYEEVCDQFVRLGELVGHKSDALRIVSDSKKTVDSIRVRREASHKGSHKPSLFIQIGADPLYAVIPGTFMADYAAFLGAGLVTEGLTHGEVTQEYIIKQDPDYIFIVTMGSLTTGESKKWQRMQFLTAAKRRQIYVLNAKMASEPSPVTFAKTLKLLDSLVK